MPPFPYFWVHFGSKIFCILFSILALVHPKMGLVCLVPREQKKTQMKNTTLMSQQTAMGPKVLKNWYGQSGP